MTPEDRAFVASERETARSWQKGSSGMPESAPLDRYLRLLDIIERLDWELNEEVMIEDTGTPKEDPRWPQVWSELPPPGARRDHQSPFALLVVADGDREKPARLVEVDRPAWERLHRDAGYHLPEEILSDCETLIRLTRQLTGTLAPSFFQNVLGPLGGEMLPRLVERLDAAMPLLR